MKGHYYSKRDMVGGIGLERACHARSLQQARQFDSFSAPDNNLALCALPNDLIACAEPDDADTPLKQVLQFFRE